MRAGRHTAGTVFLICSTAVFGQQPAPQQANQQAGPQQTSPQQTPTPEQQREKQIKLYDPLDPSSPLSPAAGAGAENSRGNNRQPAGSALPAADAALPGPFESNRKPGEEREGPRVQSGDSNSDSALDYEGPAVLSRSYTLSRPVTPQEVKWKPFVGASAVYDSGLTGSVVNSDGTIPDTGSAGAVIDWGLTGRHYRKRDQIGIDYRGEVNRYKSGSPYNGSNQFLNVDYARGLSRHLSLDLTAMGSSYLQSYTLENPVLGPETPITGVGGGPTLQFLDNGVRQFSTLANVTWQKTARLSFSYGGGFFAIDRTSLLGNTGYQAQTDVNYRYTRKLTVGLYYSFVDYTFSNHIQTSKSHTSGAVLSYALNRTTQLRLKGGGTRSESEGSTTLALSPLLTLLLGRPTLTLESYRLSWLTDASAELVKGFRHNRTLQIAYVRGIAPGNGALLTSYQQALSGGFTVLLFRRYTVSTGVGRTTLTAVSQTIGKYQTDYVFLGASRPVGRGFTGTFRFDYRRFSVTDEPLLHSQYRVALGLSWSPGEGPLRLW
jgi:hypothetical protein